VLFAWVVADSGYGRDPGLRAMLHGEHLRYVLAVAVDLPLVPPPGKPAPGTKAITRADDLLPHAKRRDQGERRSCGHGTKGERSYDWTLFAGAVNAEEPASGFEHHLLIRRSTHKKQLAGGRFDVEYAYFLVHAPVGTTLTEAVAQAGIRWQAEEDNEQGKQLTGPDQYQVRKWMPWHRWITCVMLAHAFLAAQRADHLARLSESTGPNPSCEHTSADDAPCGPDATESDRPTRAAGAMIRLTVTALAGLLALTGLAVHPSDDHSRHQPLPTPWRPPPTPPPRTRSKSITEGRSAAVVPGCPIERVEKRQNVTSRPLTYTTPDHTEQRQASAGESVKPRL
jgi:hypothetical protein